MQVDLNGQLVRRLVEDGSWQGVENLSLDLEAGWLYVVFRDASGYRVRWFQVVTGVSVPAVSFPAGREPVDLSVLGVPFVADSGVDDGVYRGLPGDTEVRVVESDDSRWIKSITVDVASRKAFFLSDGSKALQQADVDDEGNFRNVSVCREEYRRT